MGKRNENKKGNFIPFSYPCVSRYFSFIYALRYVYIFPSLKVLPVHTSIKLQDKKIMTTPTYIMAVLCISFLSGLVREMYGGTW